MRISDWSSDVCSSDLKARQPMSSQITAAFVYGSVAKKTDTAGSDIDLMLVSNELSYGELFSTLEDAGMMLGRPVNPTILSREEFDKRIANQRSEEHTSELQSLTRISYAVFCLKKKKLSKNK